ncbi:MAG: PEP-CTERM sorting domain-containing protein [Pirellula sp.]|jgi:hypothetical protein|nr:PEP-CTERM sorting domain-containing protein [Pirellula sp.]
MRIVLLCFAVLGGLSQLAPAATISAVLHPGPGSNKPGAGFLGVARQDFGAIADVGSGVGVPPSNGGVVGLIPEAFVSLDANTTAHVKADARRSDPNGTQNVGIYLTTYSYLRFINSNIVDINAEYKVINSGYWEFQVVGNYGWSITAQAPQFTGARRTYTFEKVNGTPIDLAFDNGGGSATTASGTLGTGTYRLSYSHVRDHALGGSAVNPTNPDGSTNLDIFFTFQSEDPSGVVPEPTSLAVFGLLGIGGAVAKWRRKK